MSPRDIRKRRLPILELMYRDPELFARKALKQHCRLPFCDLHRAMFRWHLEMQREVLPKRRGRRFVIAAPRGAAKSTVASLILPLHDVVVAKEAYILLLSSTERQARQRLRAIRKELESGVCGKLALNRMLERRFTMDSITFGGVQIDAFGAGSEIRGISSNGFRPTKIILDDAEASNAANSGQARERLAEWFSEIVEYLGDVYTHIFAVGTVLHEKGLIARLLERPDFEGYRAKSVESWSTREDLWARWRVKLLDFDEPDRRKSAREYFEKNRSAMENGIWWLS